MPIIVGPKAPPAGKFEHTFEASDILPKHKLICHFDVDPGERETRWEPGSPASIEMVACYLYDADILELLDDNTVARIEAAAGAQFESDASDAEAEARAEREDQGDDNA